jgi:hypothetical protein
MGQTLEGAHRCPTRGVLRACTRQGARGILHVHVHQTRRQGCTSRVSDVGVSVGVEGMSVSVMGEGK